MKKTVMEQLFEERLKDLENKFKRDQKDKWKMIQDLTNEVEMQRQEIKKLKEAIKIGKS